MRPRMIDGKAFDWSGFTPSFRAEFRESFARVGSETMGEAQIVYHALKCHYCHGLVQAVVFDDIMTMMIDGTQHRVPVKHVPAYRCFKCGNSWVDGTSDENIHYWYLQYVKKNGLYTPWKRVCRWWRNYKSSWMYWHWNRAPWARWTWPSGECPDRVKNRPWYRFW
jgi:hypothetical protein